MMEPRPPLDWAKLLAKRDEEERIRREDFPQPGSIFGAEDPEVAHVTAEEVVEFRSANNDAVVKDPGAQERPRTGVTTNPVASFDEALAMHPEIFDEMCRKNSKEPSPTHNQALRSLLQGNDLSSVAQTVARKTIGDILPAALDLADSHAHQREGWQSPSCLVLAPTRELAQQIERETKKYHYRGAKSVCTYGDSSWLEQVDAVKQGV
ncbi:probable ATP-dependent RNA helicase DDX43 [Dermacentor andersoni]|uniref:probable ATP-dependent RNA helicase DDX43 n=1 Tax=Dermacentor andersoni TaxID=34620 RepID=UPI0024177619|nr:probable ATP-dependent RNA helicase DDX43 [Dermacentor andersoni]